MRVLRQTYPQTDVDSNKHTGTETYGQTDTEKQTDNDGKDLSTCLLLCYQLGAGTQSVSY